MTGLAQVLNEDTVSPGLLGLAIVVALAIATWLLVRSMNRQLRKIDFDDGSGRTKASNTGEPKDGASANGANTNGAKGADTDPRGRGG